MRRTILFILLATATLLPARAYASTEKQVRDSIFQEVATLTDDTLRCKYLRGVFQQHIGQESATEYLDSALALSIRKQIHGEELNALFDYCRQYEYCTDLEKQQLYFSMLKEASYRYKEYALYYTIWFSTLQKRCIQGDTEYAIIEAKKMKEEAVQLKYGGGIFIATMALAQAYDYSEQYDKAIHTYLQALKDNPNANNSARLIIHGNLADIYYKQKEYTQALDELQKSLDAITKMSEGFPLSGTFKTTFLDIYISFCKIYMETEDKEKLNRYLKDAEKYYSDDIYVSTYIDYHALWGAYYMLTKEWDECFRELNIALSACRGISPSDENAVLKMKAKALMKTEQYEKAAETYKIAAFRGDSLNNDILRLHKEAHLANYKIQKALLEKEELTKRYRYMQVCTAAILLAILIFIIVHASHVQRQLRLSEEKTRKAFETIKAADKMKERFLHNITYEIRIPLNTVVGFSELLSSESNLTEEEIEEYSATVKSNSTKLLALINNVLDLSRLEAGMMRFNAQENDIVQLCKEAQMMVEMQTPGATEITYHTTLKELQTQVDSKWFLKLLTTLFAVPKDYTGGVRKIEYTLGKGGRFLTIVVKGSPLYLCWEDEQEQRILHDINRLYVEAFKGSYQILGKEDEKIVSITYPIS